ncbi:MAG: hypothetical protein U5K27_10325 [Desulfotignum sp.]|nr:hypothetical protein [Desulfotignum sp.]
MPDKVIYEDMLILPEYPLWSPGVSMACKDTLFTVRIQGGICAQPVFLQEIGFRHHLPGTRTAGHHKPCTGHLSAAGISPQGGIVFFIRQVFTLVCTAWQTGLVVILGIYRFAGNAGG